MLNLKNWTRILPQASKITSTISVQPGGLQAWLPLTNIHTSAIQNAILNQRNIPRKWPKYNDKVYPPQTQEEERRPAYVCHMKTNIKYSPWKMWYVACMVRGMTVDEALKQLNFVTKKGAAYVRQTILEAQQMAVEQHNVEFKSNLWVAESFVGKGLVVKGMRRHAKMRFGKVEYFHCHYFVRLEEGTPPKDYYYHNRRLTGPELLQKWLDKMRNRKIPSTL